MTARPYFDVHTHDASPSPHTKIYNLPYGQHSPPTTGWCSVGLHPWHLDPIHTEAAFERLCQTAVAPGVVAIGETGLDFVCSTPRTLQTHWFESQLKLAQDLGKPVVIHCVRAYDEVIHTLDRYQDLSAVIFHGFNKKAELAERLIRKGYFLSFGSSLMRQHDRAALKHCPVEQLFLETDDSGLDIAQVYEMASRQINVPVDELVPLLNKNAERVFGRWMNYDH